MSLIFILMLTYLGNAQGGCLDLCRCDLLFGICDCSFSNLKKIPFFLNSHAQFCGQLNLRGNHIKTIGDSDIWDESKWSSLQNIILVQNPINCTEVLELNQKHSVISDCVEGKSGTLLNIN